MVGETDVVLSAGAGQLSLVSMQGQGKRSFAKDTAWLLSTIPVRSNCVTLGESLHLSEPQMKTAVLHQSLRS